MCKRGYGDGPTGHSYYSFLRNLGPQRHREPRAAAEGPAGAPEGGGAQAAEREEAAEEVPAARPGGPAQETATGGRRRPELGPAATALMTHTAGICTFIATITIIIVIITIIIIPTIIIITIISSHPAHFRFFRPLNWSSPTPRRISTRSGLMPNRLHHPAVCLSPTPARCGPGAPNPPPPASTTQKCPEA